MSDERPLWVRQAAEATTYATVIAVFALVTSLLLTLVLYGPTAVALEAATWYMLVVSIGLLGIAAVTLRPQPHRRIEREQLEDGEKQQLRASEESHFTAFVMRLPPARWVDIEPTDRIRLGWKAGLASVIILATALSLSYLADLAIARG